MYVVYDTPFFGDGFLSMLMAFSFLCRNIRRNSMPTNSMWEKRLGFGMVFVDRLIYFDSMNECGMRILCISISRLAYS